MKNILVLCIGIVFLSCKGNGQTPEPAGKNDSPNPKSIAPTTDTNFMFSGDYNELLTLELASRITGFESSNAKKMHTMKGMLAETLRYYWENGREVVKEKSTTNRKRETYSRPDIVQIKWIEGEADIESFLDFLDLEKYPELYKIKDVGEAAYWNPIKNHLEVYYKGVSFTLQVNISNDEIPDKEKTIALAKLIIEEQLN